MFPVGQITEVQCSKQQVLYEADKHLAAERRVSVFINNECRECCRDVRDLELMYILMSSCVCACNHSQGRNKDSSVITVRTEERKGKMEEKETRSQKTSHVISMEKKVSCQNEQQSY